MKLFILWCFFGSLASAGAFTNQGNNYQTDGSKDDVQAACDAAPVGATVLLPSGTFTWNKSLFVSKSLVISGGPTKLLNNYNQDPFEEKGMFKMSSSPNVNMEVKNIHFGIGPAVTGPYMGRCQLYFNRNGGILLVHDCTIETNSTIAKGIRLYQNGALIWNCTFKSDPNAYADPIAIQDGADTYRSVSTMGSLDTSGTANCYVEDSTFNNIGYGYSLDISGGGRFVIRHCTFTNSYIGSHGQESDPYGMRHAEVYDCTFSVNDQDQGRTQAAIWIRGGTWVIFNNTWAIPGKSPISFEVKAVRRQTLLGCPTVYPIPRQVGQGWSGGQGSYSYPQYPPNGDGYITDPVYIWNNTGDQNIYMNSAEPDACGNNLTTAQFMQKNRDYFLSKKPNYEPYPYPHPLRTGGGPGPTPSPSPTPTPPPQPTPTPPQPTPTPTPPQRHHQQIDVYSDSPMDVIVTPKKD
jgi:hypothetical protein